MRERTGHFNHKENVKTASVSITAKETHQLSQSAVIWYTDNRTIHDKPGSKSHLVDDGELRRGGGKLGVARILRSSAPAVRAMLCTRIHVWYSIG